MERYVRRLNSLCFSLVILLLFGLQVLQEDTTQRNRYARLERLAVSHAIMEYTFSETLVGRSEPGSDPATLPVSAANVVVVVPPEQRTLPILDWIARNAAVDFSFGARLPSGEDLWFVPRRMATTMLSDPAAGALLDPHLMSLRLQPIRPTEIQYGGKGARGYTDVRYSVPTDSVTFLDVVAYKNRAFLSPIQLRFFHSRLWVNRWLVADASQDPVPLSQRDLEAEILQLAEKWGVSTTAADDAYRIVKMETETRRIDLPILGVSVRIAQAIALLALISLGHALLLSNCLRHLAASGATWTTGEWIATAVSSPKANVLSRFSSSIELLGAHAFYGFAIVAPLGFCLLGVITTVAGHARFPTLLFLGLVTFLTAVLTTVSVCNAASIARHREPVHSGDGDAADSQG
jgi:hypothetical protein